MIKKLLILARKTVKKLLYPVIYSYPGYILYDFTARLGGYKKERKRINKIIGYYPNLKNPQSFNEKVLWKKLYDRNPLLPIVSDKYRVREYIREVLGEAEANRILVPLLYVTGKPQEIPFDDLSGEYIIKPNHASGRFIIAENIENQKRYTIVEGSESTVLYESKEARSEIITTLKRWLLHPFGFYLHEWAYQKIKRRIIIEKLLRDSNGKIPTDYKLTVFYGACHSIMVVYDRLIDKSIARYTPDWEYINVKVRIKKAIYRPKPENLQSLLYLAESLGKNFDFIRADLYLLDKHIYFGEITSYPVSGALYFNPASYDFELGSKWKLVPKYWN